MKLNKHEKLLVEAVKSMLQQDTKLGLSFHTTDTPKDQLGDHRGYQYLHEQINDMFMLKAAELNHSESVTSAFNRTHNYKYIEDWSFFPVMEKDMISKGVPLAERAKAAQFIQEIVEELSNEMHYWNEKDSGFNPNMKEVRKVSQPSQANDFEIQSRHLNTKNVDKAEYGDGSPARTSMSQPPLPSDGYDAETNP